MVKKNQGKVLFVFLTAVFYSAINMPIWAVEPQEVSGDEIWTLYFENIKFEEVPLYCEVAQSEQAKRRGLMFREKLDSNMCMIFLYDNPIILTFWMSNTKIPLSIAFLNAKLRIMDIFDMKPYDENIVSSTNPGLYAVEANRGWFKKNFIYQGSVVRVEKMDMRKKSGH